MTEYSLYAFKLNRFTRLNWKQNIKSFVYIKKKKQEQKLITRVKSLLKYRNIKQSK